MYSKLKTTILIVLLCVTFFSISQFTAVSSTPQEVWVKTFEQYAGISFHVTPDGGYLIIGSILPSWESFLMKTDSAGNIQWNRTYTKLGIQSIISTSDGGWAFIGQELNAKSNPILYKTDFEGNILWNKTVPIQTTLCLCQTPDDGYVVTGNVALLKTNMYGFNTCKLDSQGNVEWSKMYGAIDYYICQVISTDSGIVIGGSIGVGKGVFLASLDFDGKPFFEHDWQNVTSAISLTKAGSSGYVFAGSIKEGSDYNGWAGKVDSTGQELWVKTFNGFGESMIVRGTSDFDNGYLFLTLESAWLRNASSLIKVDPNGNVVWTKQLGANIYPIQVNPLPNGDYLVFVNDYSENRSIRLSELSENQNIIPETPTPDTNIFQVQSNSTVTGIIFDSQNQELSFNVTGPSGTTGYTNVTIAKSILPNVDNLKVHLDGKQVDLQISSNDNSWFIFFTYSHSTHQVRIDFTASETSLGTATLAGAVVAIALILALTAAVVTFIRRKKKMVLK